MRSRMSSGMFLMSAVFSAMKRPRAACSLAVPLSCVDASGRQGDSTAETSGMAEPELSDSTVGNA
jgi:hypothetical protein